MKKFIIQIKSYGSIETIDPVNFTGSWYVDTNRYGEPYLVFGIHYKGIVKYFREELFREVNICEKLSKPKPKPKRFMFWEIRG